MLLGCHVSYSNNQLLGAALEAIGYGANTFMIYTGAPQNTRRARINEDFTKAAYKLMETNNIDINNVVCHAPYIINLANNKDTDKYKFSINFLISEIKRCEELGIKRLVLHPGSKTKLDKTVALNNIVYALNIALEEDKDVIIYLETMAGKGSELGTNLDELKYMLDGVNKKELVGVCLDTCHLNDSGVDISKFNEYIDEFDKTIGIDKIGVIHVNDSKNELGSHKDRHENIGFGTIGFDNLINVIYDERFENIPKILETPYVGNEENPDKRLYAPYKFEIDMIKKKMFDPNLKEKIRKYYEE